MEYNVWKSEYLFGGISNVQGVKYILQHPFLGVQLTAVELIGNDPVLKPDILCSEEWILVEEVVAQLRPNAQEGTTCIKIQ